MKERPRIGIIGAGAVGTALGPALAAAGYPVVAVASRSPVSAKALACAIAGCRATAAQGVVGAADLVFVTVPDDAVAPAVAALRWRPGVAAVHCSGALTLEPLAPAAAQGAAVASLHPLQAFPARGHPELTRGIAWALEAAGELETTLRRVVADLEGWTIVVAPEHRALYHAGAILACNYLVTLVKLATDLWAPLGMDRPRAVRALLPLVRATIQNIEGTGYPNCLTGPLSRGDTGTIRRHLQALDSAAPEAAAAYRVLGLATLSTARAKGGFGPERETELRGLLTALGEDGADGGGQRRAVAKGGR